MKPSLPMSIAPRFGADGVLESIRIGDVAFATGGATSISADRCEALEFK